eukprot:403332968
MVQSQQKSKRSKNDIKDVKSYKQLERLELDLESPRLQKACHNLGITLDECQKKQKSEFMQKGVDPDLAELRFKHFQSRLIDTLNRVLNERRNIKIRDMQKEILEQKMLNKSQSVSNIINQSSQFPLNSNNQIGNQRQILNPIPAKNSLIQQGQSSQNLGLATSIFQTEVGIVDQKRNKPPQLIDQIAKSQQISHRQKTQAFPLKMSSPNNIKSLLTKSAFKEQYSNRYDQLQPIMSKTTGSSFLQQNTNNLTTTSFSFRNSNNNLTASSTAISLANPLVDRKIQSDLAKIERDKSLKLLKIQKDIEHQEINKIRLEEYEKKIQKAQKRMMKKLKSQTEDKKEKNEKKLLDFQKRAVSLDKDYENKVLKDIERQNQSMTLTVQKQIQLEQERRMEMLRREQESQEKMKFIQEWRQEREQMEVLSSHVMLQSIDEKLDRSQQLHAQNLKRIASEARAKNDQVRNKILQFKQEQEDKQKKDQELFAQQQELLRKKLKNTHREMKHVFDDYKQQKQVKQASNGNKRQEEEQEIQYKLQKLQARQKEAEDIQEEQRREQEHDFLLRNEARRLREEDIKQLRDRQKRLQDQKKLQILEKEKEHKDFMRTLRESENIIQKKKLESIIKMSKEAEDIKKTLIQISVKGKVMTPRTKEKLEQEGISLSFSQKRTSLHNGLNNGNSLT